MTSQSPLSQGPATVLGEQWQQIDQAISPLNGQQLTWLSGYLAGLAQVSNQGTGQVAVASSAANSLTILYGSQTGNAKGVAQEYFAAVQGAGLPCKLVSMADYKPKQLKSESHLLIVVSTHGEGEAPDDAVLLHEYLVSKKAPKLDQLEYAVIGLGDSSYEFFCQTGKDFDERLASLGAKAFHPRLDCDVDYEEPVQAWTQAVTAKLTEALKPSTSSQVVSLPGANVATLGQAQHYSKKEPFAATLSACQKITGRDSVKQIYHVEVDIADSGIQYQPGDALGVYFINDDELVNQLLALLDLQGSEQVQYKDESLSIAQVLKAHCELTLSYPSFVKAYAPFAKSDKLDGLIADAAKLREYLSDRQIVDIVREFPAQMEAQSFVDALRALAPRLYSIASSQSEVEDEVHLTVALVDYQAFDHRHQGGASGFLTQRLSEGGEVKVYVESNQNFRLPDNPDTPIIMVGPGTGIAPFRAFMQERAEQDANGKNWLFFGNPNFTQDFLYQTEWQAWVKEERLNKISLAFSRDQEEKIYVQHRMLEQGAELYQWLEQGAYFYVCGDANQMAKDVHQALISVVQTQGNKSREEAEAYVTELRKAKRYQKDVY